MTYMMECPFCGLVQAVPRTTDPMVPWEYARNCANCRAWIVGGQRTDLPEPDDVVYEGYNPRGNLPGIGFGKSPEELIDRGYRRIMRAEYIGTDLLRRTFVKEVVQ